MKFLSVLAINLFVAQVALAQQNYPELMVAPKASERLKREAIFESKNKIATHFPIQLSALVTLAAGIASQADLDTGHDSQGVGPKLAMAVGASWLIGSIWLQSSYRPYLSGFNEVKRMPYQTPRDQLSAERMAEEHIDETARLARKLKWLSFSTNFIASTYAASSAKNDSVGKAISIGGIISSFAPLFFPYSAEQVSEDQRSYKKKVFGPVGVYQGPLIDPSKGKMIPGLFVTTSF
jgi:hypothetical protein